MTDFAVGLVIFGFLLVLPLRSVSSAARAAIGRPSSTAAGSSLIFCGTSSPRKASRGEQRGRQAFDPGTGVVVASFEAVGVGKEASTRRTISCCSSAGGIATGNADKTDLLIDAKFVVCLPRNRNSRTPAVTVPGEELRGKPLIVKPGAKHMILKDAGLNFATPHPSSSKLVDVPTFVK
ncbi:MAG: hypothetical protein MZW92_26940 [Comamonadaceae bacterium]|nr:hypothetical protein [Comamonadaceae bacterium]